LLTELQADTKIFSLEKKFQNTIFGGINENTKCVFETFSKQGYCDAYLFFLDFRFEHIIIAIHKEQKPPAQQKTKKLT